MNEQRKRRKKCEHRISKVRFRRKGKKKKKKRETDQVDNTDNQFHTHTLRKYIFIRQKT